MAMKGFCFNKIWLFGLSCGIALTPSPSPNGRGVAEGRGEGLIPHKTLKNQISYAALARQRRRY